jgi:hypothetical protein
MKKKRDQILKVLLSGWALLPATGLLLCSLVIAGMAIMNAEDFDRPMNATEAAICLLPWVPAIWLGAILFRLTLKAYNKHSKNSSRQNNGHR